MHRLRWILHAMAAAHKRNTLHHPVTHSVCISGSKDSMLSHLSLVQTSRIPKSSVCWRGNRRHQDDMRSCVRIFTSKRVNQGQDGRDYTGTKGCQQESMRSVPFLRQHLDQWERTLMEDRVQLSRRKHSRTIAVTDTEEAGKGCPPPSEQGREKKDLSCDFSFSPDRFGSWGKFWVLL